MRKFQFRKLVRDKIVDQMIASGDKPDYRILSHPEFIQELKRKLLEEVGEMQKEVGEDLVKELADLQEIIDNLLETLKVSSTLLKQFQTIKNAKAGSFTSRHYIETIETRDDSKWISHFLKNSDRYPEINK